jgi:hypothetical protein
VVDAEFDDVVLGVEKLDELNGSTDLLLVTLPVVERQADELVPLGSELVREGSAVEAT